VPNSIPGDAIVHRFCPPGVDGTPSSRKFSRGRHIKHYSHSQTGQYVGATDENKNAGCDAPA
jgi:hypothetical protein